SGRSPEEVELLAVTKTFPATDVALLSDLGLTEFAENRHQEARGKVAEFAELRPQAAVRWHMVGQLQRNKARAVARWADVVESVDSDRLVETLDRAVGNALEAGSGSARWRCCSKSAWTRRSTAGGAGRTTCPDLRI